MHEIMKYFLFTENQEQCLNPSYRSLTGPVARYFRYLYLYKKSITRAMSVGVSDIHRRTAPCSYSGLPNSGLRPRCCGRMGLSRVIAA